MEATELISRCKAGERQALNLLYQQYKPQLLNICRQYAKGDDVAEDLLHDAFVVIFTSLDRLENDDKLEAWMYAIVRNVGYHYRQHAGSATHVVSVRRFDYLRANESMKRSLVDLNVSQEIMSLYENHRWLNLVGVYMFYFVHGKELTKEERCYGLAELRRVWENIDRRLLSRRQTLKFGYCPMPTWTLFRVQEWLYFTLRGFLGKNV